MRILKITPGEHYHIFNRAVNKRIIFHDTRDYIRFLFLILHFQSAIKVSHLNRAVKEFAKSLGQHSVLTIDKRMVELVAFCIMPNHFHLIVKELEENGIASYMQRVLNAYGKYYNTKYEKTGHVFQGPYRAVHISDDRQLLYLSAYIHRNPREISRWFRKEDQYIWSSYQDFIGENRWSDMLMPDIVRGQFKNHQKYHEFVKTSPAKLIEGELDYLGSL